VKHPDSSQRTSESSWNSIKFSKWCKKNLIQPSHLGAIS
jgi:hypothetical protein